MARAASVHPATDLARRLEAFVIERFPFAVAPVRAAFDSCKGAVRPDEAGLDALRPTFASALRTRLQNLSPSERVETTPGVDASVRFELAIGELIDACDGFLRRTAIRASLTADERREILRGMVLTRATDTRLKTLFTGGEVRFGETSFQGKGFRSLGQEAIYAAGIRLRRGDAFRDGDVWRGDVVAPVIRDLGVTLAMRPDADTVRLVLSAQMAKAGPPMHGRDLHVGDFAHGILPAAAPLAIGSLTIAGMALAFAREGSGRVALSFIGEGGSSLGEWHEAINLCAARHLPAVFAVENNQTALSTPVRDQSAARVFADKATGYGIPGITIDGTDPDEVAAAFSWAVERARAGQGPSLIELVSMRMCGHAHHDDMLYIGRDPQPGWDYPALQSGGYADPDLYAFWSARDPIPGYANRLQLEGVIDEGELERLKAECETIVEHEAQEVIAAPWPAAATVGDGVLAGEPTRERVEVLDPQVRLHLEMEPALPPLEAGLAFDRSGRTFLDAVMLGVGDALRANSSVFVFGEDVGGPYGNAFLLLRPLLEEFGDRILNSPLAEGAVLGACVGAALAGQRPIGEMQFNDFVATGFNQLVNNAAKIRYRWGGSVPMVLRMPWGGLRHAGPYHSQNTEAWFYRTPGLKIVVPSTPADARALMASAVADPDPVLYFEHIALYRDPRIKQVLSDDAPAPLPIGRAALRREGDDLVIISYGAYVQAAMRVAEKLAVDRIEASVLDLRSLSPLDREAVLACARHCSRVLIVHEDSRTGGIGESLAALIQEEAFESLDAPVRILAALDTPVPYSPPLEAAFLPSDDELERAARLLLADRCRPSRTGTAAEEPPDTFMQMPRSSRVSIVAIGALVCAGAACRGGGGDAQIQASYDPSGKLRLLTYDSNKNGRPDTWSYMDGARLVRVELDSNEDGTVDRWEYYKQAGILEKVGTSRENDGRVDTWTYPAADGLTARVERSLRRDGKVSRTEHYKDGALVSADEDADNDGVVDKWEEYSSGRLVSVGFDTEKAGRPTRRLTYDRDGRLVPGDGHGGTLPATKP